MGLLGSESIQLSPSGQWALLDSGSRWLVGTATGRWMLSPVGWWSARDSCLVIFRGWQASEPNQVRPIAGCAAIGERSFSRMTKGVRQPERYKVPPAWRPTALRKTSKGLETERREGKEKEQVMTADEIIVGIVDSPSARAALRWVLRTPDRPEQRIAPFMWSTSRRHRTCASIP